MSEISIYDSVIKYIIKSKLFNEKYYGQRIMDHAQLKCENDHGRKKEILRRSIHYELV